MTYMRLIPVNKVRKTPLLQSISGRCLTRAAADVLLSRARIMHEGELESGEKAYSGTTLIDLNLGDPSFDLDAEMCANVLELVQKSIPFRLKIGRLARAEAGARMGSPAGFEMETSTSFQLSVVLCIPAPRASVVAGMTGSSGRSVRTNR